MNLKRKILINLKNLPGWRTSRKIVVFSVDDYGNVRMASEQARRNMEKAGMNVEQNRFDRFDCLEDKADLTGLYETLSSVKDKNGRHAVFTAFSLPVNIDFDRVIASGYSDYFYELLPKTFASLPGYEGTWELWQEGMRHGLMHPEFHGREHLSVPLFKKMLAKRDKDLLTCLENRSYAAFDKNRLDRSYTGAFGFSDFSENKNLIDIAVDGLNQFEKVFGFRAAHITAPGVSAHGSLEEALAPKGIRYIDTQIVKKEHQGNGKYTRKYTPLGKKNKKGQTYLLRNCVYEPLLGQNVDVCMQEIDIAFKTGKPANISSHRVNFCGHIDPKNREKGLRHLKDLLQRIVKKYPDAEFMTTTELGDLITKKGSM